MLGVAPAVAVVALLVHERGVVRARGAAAELVRVGQEYAGVVAAEEGA
jgi:hypothetical protein